MLAFVYVKKIVTVKVRVISMCIPYCLYMIEQSNACGKMSNDRINEKQSKAYVITTFILRRVHNKFSGCISIDG